MPDQQLQPLGAGHELVIAFQRCIQLATVDNHALLHLVCHFLQREGVADHVARQLLAPFCIVCSDTHLVVHGKSRVLPGEEFVCEILCDGLFFNQIVQHCMAQLPDQQYGGVLQAKREKCQTRKTQVCIRQRIEDSNPSFSARSNH